MLTTSVHSAVRERIRRFVRNYSDLEVDLKSDSRRAAPRFVMADPVEMILDTTETPAEVVLASGRDISVGGIGVYANRHVPPGTEMVVSVDNGSDRLLAKAVTVHSTMSVGMFKIGAKFVI